VDVYDCDDDGVAKGAWRPAMIVALCMGLAALLVALGLLL
jgi:hypothetical protein